MKAVKKQLKKESLMLGKLFKKIAPLIGANVFLEPEWEIAGQITFKSGKKSYFRYNTLDLILLERQISPKTKITQICSCDGLVILLYQTVKRSFQRNGHEPSERSIARLTMRISTQEISVFQL